MTRPDNPKAGARPINPETVGLPVRSFLYTLDQVAYLLNLSLDNVQKSGKVYYAGRSTGAKSPDRMMARDIAGPNESPDWRIAEQELLRWMKRKGYKVYERAWITE